MEGCEWCKEGANIISQGSIIGGHTIHFEANVSESALYLSVDNDKVGVYCYGEINYCPMCGRDLKKWLKEEFS